MQTVPVRCCCLGISPHSGLWGGGRQSHREGSVVARVVLGPSVENGLTMSQNQTNRPVLLLPTGRPSPEEAPWLSDHQPLESSFHRPAVRAPWDRPLQSIPQLHPHAAHLPGPGTKGGIAAQLVKGLGFSSPCRGAESSVGRSVQNRAFIMAGSLKSGPFSERLA